MDSDAYDLFMCWDDVVARHPEILGHPLGAIQDGTGPDGWGQIDSLCLALEQTPGPWPVCSYITVGRDGLLDFRVESATALQYAIIDDFCSQHWLRFGCSGLGQTRH